MSQDSEALAFYVVARENILKYALRLYCKQHGVTTVTEKTTLFRIQGEAGQLARLDYSYALTCGCTRRKTI